MNRRDFLKQLAAAGTLALVGVPFKMPEPAPKNEVWYKAEITVLPGDIVNLEYKSGKDNQGNAITSCAQWFVVPPEGCELEVSSDRVIWFDIDSDTSYTSDAF